MLRLFTVASVRHACNLLWALWNIWLLQQAKIQVSAGLCSFLGAPGRIYFVVSAGEGIGYPFQYFGASLVAQLVKNLPAMWETWVGSLGWIPGLGRSTGEGKGYPLQYSGVENAMDCIVHGVSKNRTWLSDFHFTSLSRTHNPWLIAQFLHL